MKKKFELVIAIVNSGFADEVMEAARDAGAKGGTVIKGHGTGSKKFMGLSLEPEKEIIWILTEKKNTIALMDAVYKNAGMDTDGQGIAFALPVENVVGLLGADEEDGE